MKDDSKVGSIKTGEAETWSFDMLGSAPFWIQKAEELNRMAEIGFATWQEDLRRLKEYIENYERNGEKTTPPQFVDVISVAFFLAALAIENLLKGHLIYEHPEYIKDGKFHRKTIGSHNLLAIANDAGVTLTDDEKDFCELGTASIETFGRYHIAKMMSKQAVRITIKGASAFHVYEVLYKRLVESIHSRPPFKK